MTYEEIKATRKEMITCFYTDDIGETHEVFIESIVDPDNVIITGSGIERVMVNISELSRD